jgi:hypothetical protein
LLKILADLTAEAEGMLSFGDGRIVQELEGAVLVLEEPVRAVANALVIGDSDRGNSPGHRVASLQTGDSEFVHHVALEGQQSAYGVVETGVAEAGLGDHGGRENARVSGDLLR